MSVTVHWERLFLHWLPKWSFLSVYLNGLLTKDHHFGHSVRVIDAHWWQAKHERSPYSTGALQKITLLFLKEPQDCFSTFCEIQHCKVRFNHMIWLSIALSKKEVKSIVYKRCWKKVRHSRKIWKIGRSVSRLRKINGRINLWREVYVPVYDSRLTNLFKTTSSMESESRIPLHPIDGGTENHGGNSISLPRDPLMIMSASEVNWSWWITKDLCRNRK